MNGQKGFSSNQNAGVKRRATENVEHITNAKGISNYLSIYLSNYLSIYLSIYLSLSVCVCMRVYVSGLD